MTIREYVNERKLNEHKNNFLEVVNVYKGEQLLKSFKWSFGKCGALTHNSSSSVINTTTVIFFTNSVTQEQRSSSEENLRGTWPNQVNLLKLVSP